MSSERKDNIIITFLQYIGILEKQSTNKEMCEFDKNNCPGKTYGNYTDEELDKWQQSSGVIEVLTSAAFGAWLLRRDEKRDERLAKGTINELEKIEVKIDEYMNISLYEDLRHDDIKCIRKIIDDKISELKGRNNNAK